MAQQQKQFGIEAAFLDIDDTPRIDIVARKRTAADAEGELYGIVAQAGLWINSWFLPIHRVSGLRVVEIEKDSAANHS